MPQRSKVEHLPGAVKAELHQRLVTGAFSGYHDLSDWLRGLGYEISKSSIHRYGKDFQEQLEEIKTATEQAKAIAEVCEDDGNLLGDALARLAQNKAFEVLQSLNSEDLVDTDFTKLLSAIANLNRSSTDTKKHAQSIKAKAKQTAEEVGKIAKQGGLTEETANEIRRKILGVAE